MARIVLSGRERLVTIQPIEDGFRLTTLRSAKEVREPASALDKLNAKYSDDMLSMTALPNFLGARRFQSSALQRMQRKKKKGQDAWLPPVFSPPTGNR